MQLFKWPLILLSPLVFHSSISAPFFFSTLILLLQPPIIPQLFILFWFSNEISLYSLVPYSISLLCGSRNCSFIIIDFKSKIYISANIHHICLFESRVPHAGWFLSLLPSIFRLISCHFFQLLNNTPLCKCTIFNFPSSIARHLDCFKFLVIMSKE